LKGVCASDESKFEHEDEIREMEAEAARKKQFSEASLAKEAEEEAASHAVKKAKESASKREFLLTLRYMERKICVSLMASSSMTVLELQDEVYEVLSDPSLSDVIECLPKIIALMPLWVSPMKEAKEDITIEALASSAPAAPAPLRCFVVHDEDVDPTPKWDTKPDTFFTEGDWLRLKSKRPKFCEDSTEAPAAPESPIIIPEPTPKEPSPSPLETQSKGMPAKKIDSMDALFGPSNPMMSTPDKGSTNNPLSPGSDLLGITPPRLEAANQGAQTGGDMADLEDLLFDGPSTTGGTMQPLQAASLMQPTPVMQPSFDADFGDFESGQESAKSVVEAGAFKLVRKLSSGSNMAKAFESNWSGDAPGSDLFLDLVSSLDASLLTDAMLGGYMHCIATQGTWGAAVKGYYMGESALDGTLFMTSVRLYRFLTQCFISILFYTALILLIRCVGCGRTGQVEANN